MVVMSEPTKIKLELMSNEIEEIIDELGRVPYNIYEFMNLQQIIDKLRKSLEDKN